MQFRQSPWLGGFFDMIGSKKDKKRDQMRDSVLRNMLNTLPDPRKSKKDKPDQKKPAKSAGFLF